MRNSDERGACMGSDDALLQVIHGVMGDNIGLSKQLQDSPFFKKWLSNLVFNLACNRDGRPCDLPRNYE